MWPVKCVTSKPNDYEALGKARLERFANRFTPPSRGRYVREPALTNERGVVAVPPPAPDPLLGVGIGVALAGVVGIVLITLERQRGKD